MQLETFITSFGLNLASNLCYYAVKALKLPISHN